MHASNAHAYYYVNGIVDFTYNSIQTKVGDATSTNRIWTEHYGANFGSSVLDPRFLQLNAGINYSINHTNTAPSQDVLTYNINANFFPGRMISLSLFDTKTIVNVPTIGNIAGYDIETTTYGGTLNLFLSKAQRKGNNTNNYFNRNNNNNNNNNAGGRYRIPLPDIMLSTSHTEALSLNPQYPQNETRDNSTAFVFLRPLSNMDLRIEGKNEKYENELFGTSYDITTLDVASSIQLGVKSSLGLEGRRTERQYENATGSTNDQGMSYQAKLDRRENARLSHSYRYGYSYYDASGTKVTNQNSNANVQYSILPELSLNGAISYNEIDYFRPATTTTLITTPEQRSEVKSGSLSLGAQYSKEFRPESLDPFVVRTSYSLDSGFTDVSDSSTGVTGDGRYYGNTAGLGLFSSGWRYEALSMEYSYNNKRDHSPLHANSSAQMYTFAASTSRIPRSNFRANAQYSVIESSVAIANLGPVITLDSRGQQSRSLSYQLTFDHAVTSWLAFIARAAQQKTQSTTNYSLATISLPGNPEVTSRQYSAALNATYPVSRVMSLRGSAGYDHQQQKPTNTETTSFSRGAGLDWRLRQIFMSADYRWREDIPENGQRIQQQSVFLRVSRPF